MKKLKINVLALTLLSLGFYSCGNEEINDSVASEVSTESSIVSPEDLANFIEEHDLQGFSDFYHSDNSFYEINENLSYKDLKNITEKIENSVESVHIPDDGVVYFSDRQLLDEEIDELETRYTVNSKESKVKVVMGWKVEFFDDKNFKKRFKTWSSRKGFEDVSFNFAAQHDNRTTSWRLTASNLTNNLKLIPDLDVYEDKYLRGNLISSSEHASIRPNQKTTLSARFVGNPANNKATSWELKTHIDTN